jgi:hypothetical protein
VVFFPFENRLFYQDSHESRAGTLDSGVGIPREWEFCFQMKLFNSSRSVGHIVESI